MKRYTTLLALSLAITACKPEIENSKPQAYYWASRNQTAKDTKGSFYYLIGGTGKFLSFFDENHNLLAEYPYDDRMNSIHLEAHGGWIRLDQVPGIQAFSLDLSNFQGPLPTT